jgi:hypothetical protein
VGPGIVQRFMVVIGPISSIYDFLTFGVLLWVFRASEALFQTGWFVESLATQTLVLFSSGPPAIPCAVTPEPPAGGDHGARGADRRGLALHDAGRDATLRTTPGRVLRVPWRSHDDLSHPRGTGQTPFDAHTARHGLRTPAANSVVPA